MLVQKFSKYSLYVQLLYANIIQEEKLKHFKFIYVFLKNMFSW